MPIITGLLDLVATVRTVLVIRRDFCIALRTEIEIARWVAHYPTWDLLPQESRAGSVGSVAEKTYSGYVDWRA